jgi:hypothetical protein
LEEVYRYMFEIFRKFAAGGKHADKVTGKLVDSEGIVVRAESVLNEGSTADDGGSEEALQATALERAMAQWAKMVADANFVLIKGLPDGDPAKEEAQKICMTEAERIDHMLAELDKEDDEEQEVWYPPTFAERPTPKVVAASTEKKKAPAGPTAQDLEMAMFYWAKKVTAAQATLGLDLADDDPKRIEAQQVTLLEAGRMEHMIAQLDKEDDEEQVAWLPPSLRPSEKELRRVASAASVAVRESEKAPNEEEKDEQEEDEREVPPPVGPWSDMSDDEWRAKVAAAEVVLHKDLADDDPDRVAASKTALLEAKRIEMLLAAMESPTSPTSPTPPDEQVGTNPFGDGDSETNPWGDDNADNADDSFGGFGEALPEAATAVLDACDGFGNPFPEKSALASPDFEQLDAAKADRSSSTGDRLAGPPSATTPRAQTNPFEADDPEFVSNTDQSLRIASVTRTNPLFALSPEGDVPTVAAAYSGEVPPPNPFSGGNDGGGYGDENPFCDSSETVDDTGLNPFADELQPISPKELKAQQKREAADTKVRKKEEVARAKAEAKAEKERAKALKKSGGTSKPNAISEAETFTVGPSPGVSESALAVEEMLRSLPSGVFERVWPILTNEQILEMETLADLDKSDLKSIGIAMGDAVKITKYMANEWC